MTTPNDMPRNTDALRLARINLRSRFQKLAGSSTHMNVDAIEIFHRKLDQARAEIRNAEKLRDAEQFDTSRDW